MRTVDGGLIAIAPEVRDALAEGRAVVALESTIITHGMPYPANLQMAGAVEALIRAEGAMPATIALMGGSARRRSRRYLRCGGRVPRRLPRRLSARG